MCNSLFLGFQSEEVSKAEVWNYSSAHDGAVKWKEERKKNNQCSGAYGHLYCQQLHPVSPKERGNG